MPTEQFTYRATIPGLRAYGLTVDRFEVDCRVVDHTGDDGERLAALRALAEAAAVEACRTVAAERPDLLAVDLTLPRVDVAVALNLPTWFRGAPPKAAVGLVAGPIVRTADALAAPALAAKAGEAGRDLPPDLRLEIGRRYEEAAAALRAGHVEEGASAFRQAEARWAWHEAAYGVIGDVPATARGVLPFNPPAAPAKAGASAVEAGRRAEFGSVGRESTRPAVGQTKPVSGRSKPSADGPAKARVARPHGSAGDRAAEPLSVEDEAGRPSRALSFRAELAAEAEELLAADGEATVKAAALGVLAGPLYGVGQGLGTLPMAASASRPPVDPAEPLSAEARRAAIAAIEAYLGGARASEALAARPDRIAQSARRRGSKGGSR